MFPINLMPIYISMHFSISSPPLNIQFSSVQFTRSVVSDSLRPHESQHARPPYSSPSPGVHSDSCPSSPWCHPAISSSVVPFSYCPQFLPAPESFPISQLFEWGGQSTVVSALASFPPKKSQGWTLVIFNLCQSKEQFYNFPMICNVIFTTYQMTVYIQEPYLILLVFLFVLRLTKKNPSLARSWEGGHGEI